MNSRVVDPSEELRRARRRLVGEMATPGEF